VLKQDRANRELASAVGEFAQTVSNQSAPDLGIFSLKALAEIEYEAQEIEPAQACTDQASLPNITDEYTRLVNSV
jgi:hypothetical protein